MPAALVPGGVLVDTQPVGPRLPVTLDGEPIGELEDDEWLEIVAAVDVEIEKVLAAGGFELRPQEGHSLVHEVRSRRECLDGVAGWGRTKLPPGVGGPP